MKSAYKNRFIPAQRIVGTVEDVLVFLHIIHDKGDDLRVIHQKIVLLDYFDGFLLQRPLQQIIDVFKMIIEGFAIDITIRNQLADGDFGKWLLLHKFF